MNGRLNFDFIIARFYGDSVKISSRFREVWKKKTLSQAKASRKDGVVVKQAFGGRLAKLLFNQFVSFE